MRGSFIGGHFPDADELEVGPAIVKGDTSKMRDTLPPSHKSPATSTHPVVNNLESYSVSTHVT